MAALVGAAVSVSSAACNRSTAVGGSGSDAGVSSGGKSDKAAPGAGSFDSCSVVSQAQASAAIGERVTPGILGSAVVEGGLACVFYGPSAPIHHDPNSPQSDTVRVVVVKGPDALRWYDDFKSRVPAQPVAGLGNQAYFDGFASLSVLKGNAYLRVAVAPAGAPPSLADEKKLAAAILPSL